MAYCCAERENKEAVAAGELMAVNLYHEQWGVLLLMPLQRYRIEEVKKGMKRARVASGGQSTVVRRPPTWEIISVMEESIGECGARGRIVWIGLALAYQFLLKASKIFAEE